MDMKTLQQLQQDAKEAEGELRSQLQERCRVAVEDILKSAGLNNLEMCRSNISRMAEMWHNNIVNLLQKINFID